MKLSPKHLLLLMIVAMLFAAQSVFAQNPVSVARIKYDGGGDWYGNRTTFVNLFRFMRENNNVETTEREIVLSITDKDFFKYPIAYIAGHGNIKFSAPEASRLREYLIKGGFLWADDDYGMDPYFRREMKKVFPESDWVALPFSHPVFHMQFNFSNGLPKIHKHDGKPPQGFGLFWEGRLVCFYTYECDLGDGWEDQDVHNDPQEMHILALRMGANIVRYAFEQ